MDEYVKKVYTMEELKKVMNELIDEYYSGVIKVILFGSYARNEANQGSDIDLMVIADDTFKASKSFALIDELKEKLGKFVDLFLEKDINKSSDFYKNIIKEGVVIYE